MKFFTQEWVDEIVKKVKEEVEFKEEAKSFIARVVLQLNKNEEKGYPENVKLFIDFKEGEIVEATLQKEETADFILEGDLDIWQEILSGKLAPVKAVLLKKINFIGELTKIMPYLKAIDILIKTIGKIETEF